MRGRKQNGTGRRQTTSTRGFVKINHLRHENYLSRKSFQFFIVFAPLFFIGSVIISTSSTKSTSHRLPHGATVRGTKNVAQGGHSRRMMSYVKRKFEDNARVIVLTPESLTTDTELHTFMKETSIGRKYSTGHRIQHRRFWARDEGGFGGNKPQCTHHQPKNTTTGTLSGGIPRQKKGATLFYLLTSEDDEYVYQLQLSVCTARESNPGIDVSVGIVPEYFVDERTMESVIHFLLDTMDVNVFCFEKLEFGYTGKHQRFNKNWLRLRLWEMEEFFERILYVDADTAILRDLSRVLSLDVDFACANDMDKFGAYWYTTYGKIQAGVLLLKPCKQIFLQMRAILENNDITPFTHDQAEQSFLDWYYKFDGTRLGYEYNYIAHVSNLYRHNHDNDGDIQPYIVHYTAHKMNRHSHLEHEMQGLVKKCHNRMRKEIPEFGQSTTL